MWQTVLSEIDHTHSPQKMHTGLKKNDLLNRPIKDIFANFYGSLGKLACLGNWNQREKNNEIDQCASTRRNPVLTKCSDLWWKKGCVTLEKAPGEYLVYKIYGVFPWDSLYFMGQYLSFSYFCKSLLFYLSLQYVDI